MKKRRILSMFFAFAMVLSISPVHRLSPAYGLLPTYGALPATEMISTSETNSNLKLVWEPNLEGATILDAGASNRNYVIGKDAKGLGILVSSSSANVLSIIEGNVLRFHNTHSSASNMRLNIITAGTGSGNPSAQGVGFSPEKGKNYLLSFNAENASRTAPASIRYYKNGSSTDYTDSPVNGTMFNHEFRYPDDATSADTTHGEPAIGIVNFGSVGSIIYLSNIKIYEIVCTDCSEGICVCPCRECGKDLDDCICCICRKLICSCITSWEFTQQNYPNATWVSGVSNTGTVLPSDLEYKSSGGSRAGTLIRNHDPGYPSGSNTSGALDNVNNRKHMVLWNNSADPGWMKSMGWSTAENYVYLKLDTTGYDNLVLRYDIRTTSISTPSELRLQYSFDRQKWRTVPSESNVSVRPINTIISREEHLPVSTYNKSEVYIRWTGTASSTSGQVEFRNIALAQDENARPGLEGELYFTHINLTPGANSNSVRFSWFTEKGTSNSAIVQFVKASELVDGKMPANPVSFTGTNATGSNVYDTNKVTVTGLVPNTDYAYRVGDGIDWSNIYTFTTQNPNSYSVLVVADPQITSSSTNWKNTLNKAIMRNPNTAFILSAGDQTGEGNHLGQIEGYVSPPELRRYPMAAVYGNHDHDMHSSYSEKIKYLPLMYNWPNASSVSGDGFNGHNYYFSYGNTLYVNIDSNIKDVNRHDAFMKNATESHPNATWIVATFHHDIYGGSRHAGSYYGDAAQMQWAWSPFLDKWNVDIAFNGHDHLYTRSKFIKNTQIQERQMPVVFCQDITARNPGAFIKPNGIQYMALSNAGDKFYELEMQKWIAYADPMSRLPEYTIMNVDGNSIIIDTYRILANGTEYLVDSITLRKEANQEDLQTLITGAMLFERGNFNKGWAAFQQSIIDAQAILNKPTATSQQIHNAFVKVYDTYFALETTYDNRCWDCGEYDCICNFSPGCDCKIHACPICDPCATHVCVTCNRTCTLHICTICNRTCTLHICTTCNRTCTLHICTTCNRTCTLHICTTCNRTCTLHICTICNRTCTLHICTICNRTCTLHTCTICERDCPLHVCTDCNRICDKLHCTDCGDGICDIHDCPECQPCNDKCACTQGCKCNCVNKTCHDCEICEDCVVHSCALHGCHLCDPCELHTCDEGLCEKDCLLHNCTTGGCNNPCKLHTCHHYPCNKNCDFHICTECGVYCDDFGCLICNYVFSELQIISDIDGITVVGNDLVGGIMILKDEEEMIIVTEDDLGILVIVINEIELENGEHTTDDIDVLFKSIWALLINKTKLC